MNNVAIAFLITALAGLSTGIGSCIPFFGKKTNTKFLAVALGFSAGVMIYVSMLELLPNAMDSLGASFGAKQGTLWAIIAFFAGIGAIAIIDKIIPENENPHSVTSPEHVAAALGHNHKLMRTGLFTALAITIHNFPEGAIISMPLRAEGESKGKAFLGGVLSGVVEPIGAVLTLLAAQLVIPALPYLLSFAAGAMLYVVVEELIPEMSQGTHTNVGTIFFAIGFSLMMVLDVALG